MVLSIQPVLRVAEYLMVIILQRCLKVGVKKAAVKTIMHEAIHLFFSPKRSAIDIMVCTLVDEDLDQDKAGPNVSEIDS